MSMGEKPVETVVDLDGTALAYFERDQRKGRPWADGLSCAPGIVPDTAAAAVVRSLAGWGASAEGSFGVALVAAGAKLRRAFHTYTLPLPISLPEPDLPLGLRPLPAGQVPPPALHESMLAAYPPNHPDHNDDSLTDLAGLYDGTLMGAAALV